MSKKTLSPDEISALAEETTIRLAFMASDTGERGRILLEATQQCTTRAAVELFLSNVIGRLVATLDDFTRTLPGAGEVARSAVLDLEMRDLLERENDDE